ncbi:MAG: IS3 family transposase [Candidatus Latescibacteria bacterium]|nr:IS3 family transposase [Candidatus Latescibacterota bacterium]
MASLTSPKTGRRYDVRMVCEMWDVPRSSYYAWKERQGDRAERAEVTPLKKRGPRTEVSDERLLELIMQDLDESPFHGEGHRKVHHRIRRRECIGKNRVLRLMRENHLLSPSRVPQGEPNEHTGRITTDDPNVMWGTDGAKIFTLDDGWVWLFAVVDHWNAECLGWHVCKYGTRFEALQPLSMALQTEYGSVDAAVARGLVLRQDNGCQYRSEHFQNQLRFWGIATSWAFVEEPQTNGVAERFNRTIKEQAIHGRIFRNLEEVRSAVRDFVELYNAEWMIEKLGYLSPAQAREAYLHEVAA